MSEPDLSRLFGGPPQLTAAHEAYAAAVKDAQVSAWAQVQFFAPVLCGCERRYDRDSPGPPQAECQVHGYLMADPETGAVVMFGIPEHW